MSDMANQTDLILAVEKGDVTRVKELLSNDSKITEQEYKQALELAGRYIAVLDTPFRTKEKWAELRKNRAIIKDILLNRCA